MILLFPGENISHHTGTLRGSTEVLLEVERGSRTVASMGRNGEDGGGCLKIGHLHLKVALMKFLFTVIAKIHYLGLAQMVKNLSAMIETWVQSWVGKIPWRREWLHTPVLLPGKSHGQRSLVGYNPWGCRESDVTE